MFRNIILGVVVILGVALARLTFAFPYQYQQNKLDLDRYYTWRNTDYERKNS